MKHVAMALANMLDTGVKDTKPLGRQRRDEWFRRRANEMCWYPTEAENLLSEYLPGRFSQQVHINRYIVDFYDPDSGLVVEIDGSSHEGREVEDAQRQAALERRGCVVMRFTHAEVMQDPSGVALRVERAIA